MKKSKPYHGLPEPSGDLFEKITQRIQREKALSRARRNVALFCVLAIISCAAFGIGVKIAVDGFNNSGFLHFSSLLFSDFKTVAAYWQSFAMAILESLPVMGLIFISSAILALLESAKYFFKNLSAIFTLRQTA